MIFHQHILFLCIALTLSFAVTNSSPDAEDFIKNLIFHTKCLKDLGCFNNGPPFYHPLLRPISVLPWDLKDFKTKFHFYPNSKNRTLLEPNKESLAKSGYNKELGLRIFIHGFNMQWNEQNVNQLEGLLEAMQKVEKSNTVLVDWTNSCKDPYFQAVANGRVVGAQTAQLIKFLQDNAGLDPKNIYIIGHSLGAHVAGWAGEMIPKLGRITGLDPAGVYFRHGPLEDPNKLRKIRLDDSDADFVDILHTNGADIFLQGAGIKEPIGHLDFYANGGNIQPGCEGVASTKIVCSHMRAVDLFLASVDNSTCQFIATECDEYENYKRGRCSKNRRAVMGFHCEKDVSIPIRTRLFFETSDKYPFCVKK